jgi:hypothetical protein
VLGKKKGMAGVVRGRETGSEVHLRAFCRKAQGGGGRLRQATAREEEARREDKVQYIYIRSTYILTY